MRGHSQRQKKKQLRNHKYECIRIKPHAEFHARQNVIRTKYTQRVSYESVYQLPLQALIRSSLKFLCFLSDKFSLFDCDISRCFRPNAILLFEPNANDSTPTKFNHSMTFSFAFLRYVNKEKGERVFFVVSHSSHFVFSRN